MLDKNQLIKLNNEKKFEKICEIFRNEYTLILKQFFKRKNLKSDDSFINMITILRYIDNGKYSDISDILTETFFYKDDATIDFSINLAIDSYNYISNILLR